MYYDEDSLCLQQSQSTVFCILYSDVFMRRSHDVLGHATAKVLLITSCAILLRSAAPPDVTSHLAPVNSTKPVHPESPLKLGIVTGYQQCNWGCAPLKLRINRAKGLGLKASADVLQPQQPHEL